MRFTIGSDRGICQVTEVSYMRSFPNGGVGHKRKAVGASAMPTNLLNKDDAIRLRDFLRSLPDDLDGPIMFDTRKAGRVEIQLGQRSVHLEPWARESLAENRLLPWRA